MAIFGKPYSILLDFSESGWYLVISCCNIILGFPEGFSEDHKLHVILWTSLNCPNRLDVLVVIQDGWQMLPGWYMILQLTQKLKKEWSISKL